MNVLKLIANEGFITVNKELIKEFGLHEAILLGCLCSKQEYWNNRAECTPDGYFFCTAEQFEDETTLSPHQQRKAFKTLEEAGVIKTKVTGIPARKYFKVVDSKLLNFLTTRGEEISQLGTEKLNSNNNKENNNKSNNIKDNTVSKETVSTPSKNESKYSSEIKEIIDYLNSKANSNYRYNSESNNKHIRARLNEGYSVDDFKKVIDVKSQDSWFVDNGFFRPQTLFGNKFENYLNEKPKQNTSGKALPNSLKTTETGVKHIMRKVVDGIPYKSEDEGKTWEVACALDENGNPVVF